MNTIKYCEPIYTGGNIYIFLGAFNDNTYFIADTANYDVTIINKDPLTSDLDNEVFDPQWQEAHLIKYADDLESIELIKYIVIWSLKNHPQGNYNDFDLNRILQDIEQIQEG